MKEMQDKLDAEAAQMKADYEKRQKELQDAQGEGADTAALEEELEAQKKRNAELEAANAKKVLQEGIKRKVRQAEFNKIEKTLSTLLPMVNEANLAASELKRNIIFTTKINKSLDPFGGQGAMKTEIMVKVDNKEVNYFYEWNVEKFAETRLFMIRELLEEFFDTGNLPKLSNEEDPFWDPPNPILIGQSFLQLENLGVCVGNEMDCNILSTAGADCGKLHVAYDPCTVDGNTDEDALPDELMVEQADELLGVKNLYFKVRVTKASNLPKDTCCNPFVTYQFKFDNGLFATEEVPGIERNPKWNFSEIHKIDVVDEEIISDLKGGSICMMVYGYPNGRAKMTQNDGGQAAMKRRMTVKGDANL